MRNCQNRRSSCLAKQRDPRFASLLPALSILLLAIAPCDADDGEPPAADQIAVTTDTARSLTLITVPTSDGKVAWSDVLRGIARAKQLDDSALDGMLPKGSFEVRSFTSRLTLMAINRGLDPNIRLDVLDRETERERLQITLDEEAMNASRRQFKEMLKGRWTKDAPGRTFGLELDEGWAETPDATELVVIVHGYNSAPEQLEVLASPARAAGHPCGWLRYPNDQSLTVSAQLLSDELKKFAREHPQRKLVLLTHSMGCMVARQCVETAALNPGNVNRLIMVAPPNGGSRLADFAIGADLYEHLQVHRSSADLHERFIDRVHDGLNEASHDLTPDSAYLRKMAGLQRNPDIRYAILLGTKAPATRRQLDDLRSALQSASDENHVVKLLRPKLDAWLADLDELVDGEGDGIVAVRRGRLAGVDDTVLIPFNHLLTDPKSAGAQQVQAAIGERLRAE